MNEIIEIKNLIMKKINKYKIVLEKRCKVKEVQKKGLNI